MQGSVKGVQYDRLGHITIGGVGVFRTSTPEPSTDGISWQVEKDLTSYTPLLRTPQPVVMELGNVVNDTYTGVLDIVVTLDFYMAGHGAAPARTANAVLPLQDQRREDSDLVGTATLPRNTSRLLGEVYVTGSGGGCEEFWDTSAPESTGYSCPDGSPYREVDVLIDGKLAGIALPYPYIYTGGWSNPYSWRPSPAPRAFDIKPLYYDLTPFTGLLTDGKPHEFRIHVDGVPAGQSGWFTVPNLHVWTDPFLHQTHGKITSYSVTPLTKSDVVTGASGEAGSVKTTASRSLKISGYVDTSAGRIRTTVQRTLSNKSDHVWEAGESRDTLDASWRDLSLVTSGARVERTDLTYGKSGYLSFLPNATIPGGYDVITDLDIYDRTRTGNPQYGRDLQRPRLLDLQRPQRPTPRHQQPNRPLPLPRHRRLLRPHPVSHQRRLRQGLLPLLTPRPQPPALSNWLNSAGGSGSSGVAGGVRRFGLR